jgi:ubiquitin carboxyl-terminal hydrolase 9/24
LFQFVKGELLEGDNAYFCEKCHEKRNAIKRMCIRSLPQTLVIQLKRFHYDWETNRALKFDDFFQFPWTIDMGPYTTEGIQVSIL